MRRLNARQLAREKLAFRYSSALERGDFDTVSAVLRDAEHDATLAKMITELNVEYERDTLRLSPSLPHSTNHRQKELIMTTLVLPQRRPSSPRWLPYTIAAACLAALFIGALMMRPPKNNPALTGMQANATPTSTPLATVIPTEGVPLAAGTALPPTVIPPISAGSGDCGFSMTMNDSSGTIANTTTRSVPIYAAPLNANKEASVIGSWTADATATVLSTTASQSGITSDLWYLIMTSDSGAQQVTGWVSAASIAQALPCPTQVDLTVPPVIGISSVAGVSGITQCVVLNPSSQGISIFAAPLTTDSIAPTVGILPANQSAVVITHETVMQPANTVWLEITIPGSEPNTVTGWVTAESVVMPSACVTPLNNAEASGGGSNAIQATTGFAMSTTMAKGLCTVINTQKDSVPVYSGPSSKADEAVLVNNLTPDVPASVLYQQVDKASGMTWYLVLAVMEQSKQISGWVSADSVTVVDACPPVTP